MIKEIGAGEIIGDRVESDNLYNITTLKAIKEVNDGKTIKCNDFDDYLKKVK